MNPNVHVRTDNGHCGWWCDEHEVFTGRRGWCRMCDGEEVAPPDLSKMVALLSQHIALGDDEGVTQCACGLPADFDPEDDVEYRAEYALGPDERWHLEHLAGVLEGTR